MRHKIYIAGHKGMVGSAIRKKLLFQGHSAEQLLCKTREELNLTNQQAVLDFFERETPDQVYLAAAKVGGIHANNTYPAEFIFENLMIESNIINAAFQTGVKKLLFLGSSCIYPKDTIQPISESALLTGPLESTNEPYAIAKIAGIKLCESFNRQYGATRGIDYRSVMPTNLYGPGDNYHKENSHVVPALIRRFHEAKLSHAQSVTVWGTGLPRRELLHVDDMAEASIYIMNLDKEIYSRATFPMQSHINVGSGSDISIADLAKIIAHIVQYAGDIVFDTTKPDGTMRKLMDNSKIKQLGWAPGISLEDGLTSTYNDFLSHNTRKD
ncbi:GDP-L-fucose synthase family protein [Paludibacterium purpuratum]|uniref:GDP-L-fucose synthase n=1 Tax=Paludibacterium purpuratum TaxID=1144873 RepID=A0A4R7B3I0_9NEIS|nr:GDP-L-fucose synthase [Paludibacterium purpuratum]TDR76734.1 GDP-L-fucose synthase [Paludibacterium purpuratum]